jgi:hypothetical protein
MTEEMKNKKLDEMTMDMVSGGTSKEMVSDSNLVAALQGIKSDSAGPGVVAAAFDKAGVKVSQNSSGTANVYERNEMRISRYEALVRVARAYGKGTIDLSPYLADTASANQLNVND